MNLATNMFYVFAHHIKMRIKKRQPIWPYVKQLPYVVYFNVNKKSPLDLELPWLTIGAILHLKKILNTDMRVFEYGSGGSTLFFSKRVKEIVSVEHDVDWFATVQRKLRNLNRSNSTLILMPPSKPDMGQSVRCKSNWKKEYAGLDFYDYVHIIDKFEDDYFDLIVIDGRARPYCLKNSIKKLRPGGLLVFDNADRLDYQDSLFTEVARWMFFSYTGHVLGELSVSTTNIYTKPFGSRL